VPAVQRARRRLRFLNDVFVPDDAVIGDVDGGWTVARAALGNESVTIGGGGEDMITISEEELVARFDAHPERLAGGARGSGGTSLGSRQWV